MNYCITDVKNAEATAQCGPGITNLLSIVYRSIDLLNVDLLFHFLFALVERNI